MIPRRDSDTHPQGGDPLGAPFMDSAGLVEASPTGGIALHARMLTATAAMLREADPFRPIPRVPEVRQPNEKLWAMHHQQEPWTPEQWAYALAREAEWEAANPDQSNISQENEEGAADAGRVAG